MDASSWDWVKAAPQKYESLKEEGGSPLGGRNGDGGCRCAQQVMVAVGVHNK
jgi:hypothetical protein